MQEHQRMHLSTQSHLIRSKGWKKSIAELNQNKILRNVERAGFLASNVEQESGPFGLTAPLYSGGVGQGWVYVESSVLGPALLPLCPFSFM